MLTHNKTGTGYYVIHTQRDTSMSGFIYLNNDSIDVSKIDVNSMTNSITYSINQNGVSINLTTDLIGNIYTETCSVNNINYEMYTLKEKSNDSVRIYLGTWVSEVITPINSFTETGIWNLVTNNSIINGSNGEGLLPGTKNGSQLKGEHADGNYSGSQLKSNCEGTFTWSSRGVSGTGNWNSKQAF